MTPLVSVIIPCFEQADLLGQAVDSALSQGSDVEVIVVDDGSSVPVPPFPNRTPAVRLIRQENRGVSAARNAGLAAAAAPYAIFLDADDRLLPGAADAGIRCMEDCPDAGFVFGRHRFIKLDGSPAGRPGNVIPDRPSYANLLQGNYIGTPSAVLFRVSALRESGGFDPERSMAEDYEAMLRLARARPFRFHDTLVSEYRRYPSSVSADASAMLRAVVSVIEAERGAVPRGPCTDEDFDRGAEFFRLFYGVRVVRQAWREALLAGRPISAWRRLVELRRAVGWKLALVRLPPAVIGAAARKTRYIIDGWRADRAARSRAR